MRVVNRMLSLLLGLGLVCGGLLVAAEATATALGAGPFGIPVSHWAALLEHYRASHRRLLLLDYDGTLVPLAPLPDQAVPEAELRRLLSDLAANEANTVVVISGRDNVTL